MNELKDLIHFPLGNRKNKPRKTGLTMVMDKGLGLDELSNILASSGDYIDMIKFGFGTSALYPDHILRKKISLIREADILVFPGGTFFEIIYLQNKTDRYYDLLLDYGFSGVEISDGTIDLPLSERIKEIEKVKKTNLKVITEIGKKDPRDMISLSVLRKQMQEDLHAGADKVIVEGRESGKNVMLYNQKGELIEKDLEALLKNQIDLEAIIWETPLKSQQEKMISLFGPNVNLGNIAPQEIFALESLRLGLRGDTLRLTLQAFKETAAKISSLI